MLHHVVLLTFDPGSSAAQHDALVTGLTALPQCIESIRHYEVRRDAGVSAGTADLAVLAMFDDVDGFEGYRDHPEHQRVIAELLAPITASRVALQYTSGGH